MVKYDHERFVRVFNQVKDERGLILDQISIETGILKSTLSRISNGKECRIETMVKLLEWINYSLDDFTDGAKEDSKKGSISQIWYTLDTDVDLSSEETCLIGNLVEQVYHFVKWRKGEKLQC